MKLNKLLSASFLPAILAVLMLCSAVSANAENEASKKTYKMMIRYPITIPFKYSCVEKTDVARQMIKEKSEKAAAKESASDTAKFYFQRRVATNFTLFNKDLPKDGFSNYVIRTDSINHTITANGKTKHFDTNSGDLMANWNDDLEQYSIPVSREFTYLVTPYDEFADIINDKDILDNRRQVDSSKSMKAADRCLWRTSLADERLYQITDIKKIEFPTKRIEEDSSWLSPIEFQIEGVTIFDTVSVKFTQEKGRFLFMEAKFSPRYFSRDSVIEYGFRNAAAIPDSVKLNCVFKLVLTPTNTVDSSSLTAEGNIGFTLTDGRKFVDAVKSDFQWVKLGQYNW